MKAKLLFLILFVPLHSILAMFVLQHAYNPPPGGHSTIFRIFFLVVTAPILLPLVRFDPDGEILPKWVQALSYPLNSLLSGIVLLFLATLVGRWRASRRQRHALQE